MFKNLSKTTTASLAALATAPALAGQALADGADGYHHGWDWGWGGGHMIFGSLMMVVFWGLVVFLIVLLVRRIGGGANVNATTTSGRSALEVLQERYARGEIDAAEFEDRKGVLAG